MNSARIPGGRENGVMPSSSLPTTTESTERGDPGPATMAYRLSMGIRIPGQMGSFTNCSPNATSQTKTSFLMPSSPPINTDETTPYTLLLSNPIINLDLALGNINLNPSPNPNRSLTTRTNSTRAKRSFIPQDKRYKLVSNTQKRSKFLEDLPPTDSAVLLDEGVAAKDVKGVGFVSEDSERDENENRPTKKLRNNSKPKLFLGRWRSESESIEKGPCCDECTAPWPPVKKVASEKLNEQRSTKSKGKEDSPTQKKSFFGLPTFVRRTKSDPEISTPAKTEEKDGSPFLKKSFFSASRRTKSEPSVPNSTAEVTNPVSLTASSRAHTSTPWIPSDDLGPLSSTTASSILPSSTRALPSNYLVLGEDHEENKHRFASAREMYQKVVSPPFLPRFGREKREMRQVSLEFLSVQDGLGNKGYISGDEPGNFTVATALSKPGAMMSGAWLDPIEEEAAREKAILEADIDFVMVPRGIQEEISFANAMIREERRTAEENAETGNISGTDEAQEPEDEQTGTTANMNEVNGRVDSEVEDQERPQRRIILPCECPHCDRLTCKDRVLNWWDDVRTSEKVKGKRKEGWKPERRG